MNDLAIKNVMFLNENDELKFGNVFIKDGLISEIQTDDNWHKKINSKETYECKKTFYFLVLLIRMYILI
jgi:dihydroorotase-like cyclic amidohydrolase